MSYSENREITPGQAYEWLSSGEAILIDVREPDEFRTGHIPYALSLPLGEVPDLPSKLKIPAGRKVIFQCLKGKRGGQACAIVQQGGGPAFAVYNISGGIDGWEKAGLPLVGSGSTGLSIFRQVQIIVGALLVLLTVLGFSGHVWAHAVAGALGGALFFAGLTGWCGLASFLRKAPWNI